MHNAVVVIRNAATVNAISIVLVEVIRHPSLDILPVDYHVIVPIRAGLLVPEPEGVSDLVYYNTKVPTSISD